VSPDDEVSHARFRDKYSLPFTLLADPDHRVSDAYGVWVEKNRFGWRSMGIKRSTFVVDEEGGSPAPCTASSPRATPTWFSRP
jgi:thioredoxin-dependent peroxiredoxin